MPEAGKIESELSAINMAALERLTPEAAARMTRKDVRNLNNASLAKDFEDFWIYSIGETLYKKFVDGYSRKMWLIDDNRKIDDFTWSPKGVTVKEGPRAAWDTAISAYPIAYNGYDDYFAIAHRGRDRAPPTEIERVRHPQPDGLASRARSARFDIIVNTISPDLLFDKCYGELPYVGRDLHVIVLPVEFALPEDVYFVYYAGKEPFTRVVEYKKFTLHKAPTTLITLEIPSDEVEVLPDALRIGEGARPRNTSR